MTLRDVRDFVRHHAGEFAFVFRFQHQAGIDADEAAGQREGVDAGVAHREEAEALARRHELRSTGDSPATAHTR